MGLIIIDGELIVNNDGWHGMQTVEASAYLSAGSHTITIPFYEDGGGSGLIVEWSAGGDWYILDSTVTSPMNTNIEWGSSGDNTKSIAVAYTDITCPDTVSIDNWIGTDTYGDTFGITVDGSTITAQRTDSG